MLRQLGAFRCQRPRGAGQRGGLPAGAAALEVRLLIHRSMLSCLFVILLSITITITINTHHRPSSQQAPPRVLHPVPPRRARRRLGADHHLLHAQGGAGPGAAALAHGVAGAGWGGGWILLCGLGVCMRVVLIILFRTHCAYRPAWLSRVRRTGACGLPATTSWRTSK